MGKEADLTNNSEEIDFSEKFRHWWDTFDVDDRFAFKTPKVVVIRHRTLGLTLMGLLAAVVAYIVWVPIILEKGYLKTSPSTVIPRFSLRGPCCNSTIPNPNCRRSCQPEWYNSAVSYCDSAHNHSYDTLNMETGTSIPCSFEDSSRLMVASDTAVTVATRVRKTIYTTPAGCTGTVATNVSCLPQESGSSNYFIGDVESHSLMVTFSVFATFGAGIDANTITKQWSEMKGKVVNFKGEKQREITDNRRPGDIFSVGEVLGWAGVDLNDPHDGKAKSKRYDGVLVLARLLIEADEAEGTNPQVITFKYTWKFEEIKNGEFDLRVPNSPVGLVQNTEVIQGIRIVVVGEGQLGRFSFSALLVTISSGFVLVKAIRTAVKLVATKLMKHRHQYYAAMTDVTDDFSDMLHARGYRRTKGGWGSKLKRALKAAPPAKSAATPLLLETHHTEQFHASKAAFRKQMHRLIADRKEWVPGSLPGRIRHVASGLYVSVLFGGYRGSKLRLFKSGDSFIGERSYGCLRHQKSGLWISFTGQNANEGDFVILHTNGPELDQGIIMKEQEHHIEHRQSGLVWGVKNEGRKKFLIYTMSGKHLPESRFVFEPDGTNDIIHAPTATPSQLPPSVEMQAIAIPPAPSAIPQDQARPVSPEMQHQALSLPQPPQHTSPHMSDWTAPAPLVSAQQEFTSLMPSAQGVDWRPEPMERVHSRQGYQAAEAPLPPGWRQAGSSFINDFTGETSVNHPLAYDPFSAQMGRSMAF